MERLTFEGNFCDIAQCSELPCKHGGDCTQKEVWERLKAYEDAWLTPAEVLSMHSEWSAMMSVLNSIGSYDRLRELAEADRDGRVLILPHEDYTWSIRGDIAIGIVKANCRHAAEAEKALQEMEGKT